MWSEKECESARREMSEVRGVSRERREVMCADQACSGSVDLLKSYWRRRSRILMFRAL